jgi:hypothetical protein
MPVTKAVVLSKSLTDVCFSFIVALLQFIGIHYILKSIVVWTDAYHVYVFDAFHHKASSGAEI